MGRAAAGDPQGHVRLREPCRRCCPPCWRQGSRNGAWCRSPTGRRAALRRLLSAITAVYAIDGALTEIGRAFFVPLTLSVVQSFASEHRVRRPADRPAADAVHAAGRQRSRAGVAPHAALAQAAAVDHRHRHRRRRAAGLCGACALRRPAARADRHRRAGLSWLGYLAIRAFTREPPQRGLPVGAAAGAALRPRRVAPPSARAADRAGADLRARHLRAAVPDAAVGLLGRRHPRLVEVAAVRRSRSASSGSRCARILVGIVLFIALLFATRLFQRWLRDGLLQSRLDPRHRQFHRHGGGLRRHRARGAAVAVSYAGFDITNLAIVAGALSVGIGFGLQSIVNNFVSGLILLIERPIKVGDWIVVGDQQGHVRRISVRATEIETFDRASLIVPNSELITGRVLNWTHRNSLGRGHREGRRRLQFRSRAGDRHPAEVRRGRIRRCCARPRPAPRSKTSATARSSSSCASRCPTSARRSGVQSELRVAIFKALAQPASRFRSTRSTSTCATWRRSSAILAEALEQRRMAAAGDAAARRIERGKRLAGERGSSGPT